MELFHNIIIKLALGIMGIMLYSLYKSRSLLIDGFDLRSWVKANLPSWLWSNSILVIIIIIITIEPKTSEAIKLFTGLDISGEFVSFLTLGIGLAGLSSGSNKAKIYNKLKSVNKETN